MLLVEGCLNWENIALVIWDRASWTFWTISALLAMDRSLVLAAIGLPGPRSLSADCHSYFTLAFICTTVSPVPRIMEGGKLQAYVILLGRSATIDLHPFPPLLRSDSSTA